MPYLQKLEIELNVASLAAYLGETDTNYDEEQNLVSRYVAYHIATTAYSYADLNADIDNNTSKISQWLLRIH